MDIVHTAEMPWGESLVRQRGGDIAHKRLFEGEEESADNYMLVLAREVKEYFSPRHRHPWDQVRFCLEGAIPIGKDLYVEGGEIAYFPESAPYGPQRGGTDRIVLLLQFGGASGQGFIGVERLNAARAALEKTGKFQKGVFIRDGDARPKRLDAYEAIWQHVTGRALDYAEPAYKTPIVMRPAALPWKKTGIPNVSTRSIGLFPHRGLAITGWKIDPGGAVTLRADGALCFLFVTHGGGEIGGHALRDHSAVRLSGHESAELRAARGMELLELSVAPVASLARRG
jgi:hypothetical protein